jgi:hypothetical protein
MDKQLELNFNLNGPSPNGRIYDKDQILEQIENKIDNNELFIYKNIESNNITDVIGKAFSCEEKNGVLKIGIEVIDPLFMELIRENSKFTTCGVGSIDNDNNIIDFELTSFALTDK